MLSTRKEPRFYFCKFFFLASWAEVVVSMAAWRGILNLVPVWWFGGCRGSGARLPFLSCGLRMGRGAGHTGSPLLSHSPCFWSPHPCKSSHLSTRNLESPLTLPFPQAPPPTCPKVLCLLPPKWFSHLPRAHPQPLNSLHRALPGTPSHVQLLLLQPAHHPAAAVSSL